MNEENAFWRRVIASKFGVEERGWLTNGTMRSHKKSLWKKIEDGKERFLKYICWSKGRGYRIRLWEDQWIEGGLLKDQFLQIYDIAQNKGVQVCDCFVREVDDGEIWQVLVYRNLNDWELNEYEKLMRALSIVSPGNNDDTPRWTLTENESFTVKSCYKGLLQSADNGGTFPYKQIWKVKVRTRISFLLGKLVGSIS